MSFSNILLPFSTTATVLAYNTTLCLLHHQAEGAEAVAGALKILDPIAGALKILDAVNEDRGI
jgi:hypothetical protein